MKRIVSLFLTVVLLFNIVGITAQAETVTVVPDPVLDHFIDKVFEIEQKQEFVNFLMLYLNTSEEQKPKLIDAYKVAFGKLGESQQARVESFGVTIDAVVAFAAFIDSESFSVGNLEDYLNTDNKEAFKTAIYSRELRFREALASAGADIAKLDAGFDRMDKLFGMLELARLANTSGLLSVKLFQTNVKYGAFTLLESGVQSLITFANGKLVDGIAETAPVVTAMRELVNFYNGSTIYDKTMMYDYLDRYGFINLVVPVVVPPVVTPSTPPATPAVAPGSTTTPATIEEDLVDDGIAQGLNPFVDTVGMMWAIPAILKLYTFKIVNGKSISTFDPNGKITRAEFASMLTRMLELNAVNSVQTFKDILNSAWYTSDVQAAYENGFVLGTGSETFNPNGYITREEMGLMISRVLVINGVKLRDATVLNKFTDATSVHSWALTGTQLSVQEGLITGRTKTTLVPLGTTTRAEAAVILYRLAQKITTKVKF